MGTNIVQSKLFFFSAFWLPWNFRICWNFSSHMTFFLSFSDFWQPRGKRFGGSLHSPTMFTLPLGCSPCKSSQPASSQTFTSLFYILQLSQPKSVMSLTGSCWLVGWFFHSWWLVLFSGTERTGGGSCTMVGCPLAMSPRYAPTPHQRLWAETSPPSPKLLLFFQYLITVMRRLTNKLAVLKWRFLKQDDSQSLSSNLCPKPAPFLSRNCSCLSSEGFLWLSPRLLCRVYSVLGRECTATQGLFLTSVLVSFSV